jgi:hypothetical protein
VARLWLHAARIELPHPDDGRALRVEAPPGHAWVRLLGGGDPAWPLARGTMRRTCVGPVSGGDAPEAPC